MQKLNLRVALPSCMIDKKLISQLESFLLNNIPRLLKKELLHQMGLYDLKSPASLMNYSVVINEKKESHQLESIKKFKPEHFDSKTRMVALNLKIGRPELIDICLRFPTNGSPSLIISTISDAIKKVCPRMAEQLLSLFDSVKNYNHLVSRTDFRLLVLLTPPTLATIAGILLGGELFFLLVAQGWLLIFSAILAFNLFRIFPMVAFHTRRPINLKKVGALAVFAVNITIILAYTALLYLNLELIDWPF